MPTRNFSFKMVHNNFSERAVKFVTNSVSTHPRTNHATVPEPNHVTSLPTYRHDSQDHPDRLVTLANKTRYGIDVHLGGDNISPN